MTKKLREFILLFFNSFPLPSLPFIFSILNPHTHAPERLLCSSLELFHRKWRYKGRTLLRERPRTGPGEKWHWGRGQGQRTSTDLFLRIHEAPTGLFGNREDLTGELEFLDNWGVKVAVSSSVLLCWWGLEPSSYKANCQRQSIPQSFPKCF